jgi:hypothetical protein
VLPNRPSGERMAHSWLIDLSTASQYRGSPANEPQSLGVMRTRKRGLLRRTSVVGQQAKLQQQSAHAGCAGFARLLVLHACRSKSRVEVLFRVASHKRVITSTLPYLRFTHA